MIDIELIRKTPDIVKKAVRDRGVDADIDYIRKADEKRRKALSELEDMRAEHNREADAIAKLSGAEREAKIVKSRELKDRIGHKEFELKTLEEEIETLMHTVPNLALPEVPMGKSERENLILREVGEKPRFEFEPLDHAVLGARLGIIDFGSGSKVAGAGFYYLKNEGVLLELALVRHALDVLQKRDFTLFLTPDLARSRFYLGTGYAPRGPEAQTYEIKENDLGLIATAEITLAGVHADEIFEEGDLPRRYAGYSHCFRQEAGSYGKYSKGLYRVHQFTKVEMFAYTKPEDSGYMHEEFLRIEEELWQSIGIPYRVVEMCAGDLGASQAARKFDLEAWMPGRGDWGEVTSTSNTTDYQARNLNIRYRGDDGGNKFVHTLNGTALATSRAIVAILENYQDEEGGVKVPEALRPYMPQSLGRIFRVHKG